MKHSKPKTKRTYKRSGCPTKTEKAIVAALALDAPRAITPSQTTAIARMFNRSEGAVKNMVAQARENFTNDALHYVDIHRAAAEGALATNDFDTARKAAAWAIEHVSSEGKRIVEKAESGPSGVRIMLGVRLGGLEQQEVAIAFSESIEGEAIEEAPTETEQ